jgi:Glycoside-hydrolase family GH114/Carboxypeptidase regulatory-like domain
MQRFRSFTISRVIAMLVATLVMSATVLVATVVPAGSAPTWWTAPAGNLPWQWYLAGALDLSNPTEMGTNDTLPGGGAAPAPIVYDIDAIDNPESTVSALHTDGDHVICYIEVGTAGNYYTTAQEGITTTYFQQLQSAGDLSSNELQGYPEYFININQSSAVSIIESMIKQQCAGKGFDAVETDLDETYGNNEGTTPWTITEANEQTYLTTLANYMHSLGLGWIEKNLDDTGDNFASTMEPLADGGISEQCNEYGTCGALSSYLGKKAIFNAEYTSSLYPGFCTYDNANGINGALFNVDLDGPRSPCNGPAGAPATATTLTTSLSGGGQSGASISVPSGTQVTDSATLSGTNAGEATGTVTYRVYSNSTCSTEVGSANQVSIATAGVMPGSGPVSLTTSGVYYWQATYSGDSNNESSTSQCGSEVEGVAVSPASTGVTTSLSGGGHSGASIAVPFGTQVTDSATLSGSNAGSATGTLTYRVYSDSGCSVEVGSADPVSITTPGAIPASSPVTLSSPGTYYWQASYSGDGLNDASTSTCGSAAAVTLGDVAGTVVDGSSNPVESAEVEVCPAGASGSSCEESVTAADGAYTVANVPNGTYTATVFPPAGSSFLQQTSSDLAVTAPATTTENFSLSAAVALPAGTFLTSPLPEVDVGSVAVPVISATLPAPITTTACSGGTVTATVSATDAKTDATGSTLPVSLVEKPAGSGTFTGILPGVEPLLGIGTLTITVSNCPDPSGDTVSNSTIFIDPNGRIVNGWDNEAPVSGAKVTLLSSTSSSGTYTAVANGSVVMSAGNRRNPYTTSKLGLFGWDTAPGFYKIRATKTNCGTVTTAAFRGPPSTGTLKVVLDCPGYFSVTTHSLPVAALRVKYRVQLVAIRGSAPYAWKVVANSGTLPKGLTLSASGLLSGTPVGGKKVAHTYTFTVIATTKKATEHPYIQTSKRKLSLLLRV